MSLFLDERVSEHARTAPDAPSIGTPAGWQTYGELATRARHLAASLQASNIGPGTFVLNVLPNSAASVVAGLAIQRTGACLVEVNRDWGSAFITKVARITNARHAIVHARDASRRSDGGDSDSYERALSFANFPPRLPPRLCGIAAKIFAR